MAQRVGLVGIVLLGTLVASCGGGDATGPVPQGQAKALSAKGTGVVPVPPQGTNSYFDAEWLFAKYVAPMNPPSEVKEKFLVDLQRLANGFKLQQATGKDVESAIKHFDATVSGPAGQRLLKDWAVSMQDPKQRLMFMGLAGTAPSPSTFKAIPPSAAESEQRRLAQELDAAALAGVRATISKHQLPYDLSDTPTPWIEWNAESLSGKKGGGGGGGGGGGSPPPPPASHNVTGWDWTTGDVLYLEWNVTESVNLNPLGHMALMDRNDPSIAVAAIDAHPDNPGSAVRRYPNADELASRYRYAEGHHMNIEYFTGNYGWNVFGSDYRGAWSPMSSARREAVWAATEWVGTTTYSAFSSKGVGSTTYCSLMVWAAYQRASYLLRTHSYYRLHPGGWYSWLNIDLDSDGGYWVFPRDILRSTWVQGAFQISDKRPAAGGGGGGGGGCPECVLYGASGSQRWPVRAVPGQQ